MHPCYLVQGVTSCNANKQKRNKMACFNPSELKDKRKLGRKISITIQLVRHARTFIPSKSKRGRRVGVSLHSWRLIRPPCVRVGEPSECPAPWRAPHRSAPRLGARAARGTRPPALVCRDRQQRRRGSSAERRGSWNKAFLN